MLLYEFHKNLRRKKIASIWKKNALMKKITETLLLLKSVFKAKKIALI